MGAGLVYMNEDEGLGVFRSRAFHMCSFFGLFDDRKRKERVKAKVL